MGVKDVLAGVANALSGGVLEKVTGIIDKAVTDKDLKEKLKAELETLARTQEHEQRMALVRLEEAVQTEQLKTIQAELAQSDLYTKQTRPRIARQSWYVSGAYAIGSFAMQTYLVIRPPKMSGEALDALLSASGFQWEIYLAAAAPALTYMGVRSFDIWRRGGAKVV